MIFRRRLFWAAVLVLTAALIYALYFSHATKRSEALTQSDAGLEWLRRAYALSASEMETVRRTHDLYMPRCEAMCAELAAARAAMMKVFDRSASLEEIKAAQVEVNRCEQRCIALSLEHMEEIANLLPPSESADFRRRVLRRLLGYPTRHHEIFEARPAGERHATHTETGAAMTP